MIVDLYQMQKQLVTLIDSQKGIQNVFQRMVSIFLGFLCVLLFLVVLGLSVNTVFISGAASISSMTVALSKAISKICYIYL
jgi:Flp pilus assembly protein TadB